MTPDERANVPGPHRRTGDLALAELRERYAQGANIMRLLRDRTARDANTLEDIEIAYDLQSGVNTALLRETPLGQVHRRYAAELAGILDRLSPTSILEAGVGEATTFCAVVRRLSRVPGWSGGFDISWSRLAHSRANARAAGLGSAALFAADLLHIPLPDDSVEVVYTAHAIEPNRGRELEAVAELARVTSRWIVLFEPSWELGSAATRARIEEHRYCRGLPDAARELGLEIVEHALLEHSDRDSNQTAVLLLRKHGAGSNHPAGPGAFACPRCLAALEPVRDHLFCTACGLVYPVLDGLPCLVPSHAILASQFGRLSP